MTTWTTKLFEEMAVGDRVRVEHTVDAADIALLVTLMGDRPALDRPRPSGLRSGSALGIAMLVAHAVGTRLPGPGAILLEERLRFHGRIALGDVLTATLVVREKRPADRTVLLAASCTNQQGDLLAEGDLVVGCPPERLSVERPSGDDRRVHRTNAFARLFERCTGIPPVRTAVVHPCDAESLRGALDAARRGLIVPVLVGPEGRIRAIAAECSIDLEGVRLVPCEHSHAAAAAGVALARAGTVEALMKGSLHTDELMAAVVDPTTGLRTARRMSHVFVMDVPAYPKPLLITDAAINIAPTLEDKVDICQNAIDLAHVLGMATPKVAILSAVETVTPKIQSTIDAAALCKMAARGQITGALLDGPLAFDNAISAMAARVKGIESAVAGDPDILLVPDLESGNMLAKQLTYLAGAESAGIVLGARVPIVLTSRADPARSREASTAIMVLVAHARRRP